MAVPGAALARAVAALATNKKLQRGIGWFLVAIFSPLILLIAFLCSLGDGTAEHNNAAVDLCFHGGPIPDTMPDDYAGYIQDMQSCLTTLDGAIAEINRHMLFGSLDGALIKSTYYVLTFGDEELSLSASDARKFADCFVDYEEETQVREDGVDPETGEPNMVEEVVLVATAAAMDTVRERLADLGYSFSEDWTDNTGEVYNRIAYGNGGSYFGDIQSGGPPMTELDVSEFEDPTTKNAADLVAYAIHAWESGWGYVWGTYGNILSESRLDAMVAQYPDGVGSYADFIRANWVGRRTTDCMGLIKGYGWLDSDTLEIVYGTNGMPDVNADTCYAQAKVKGPMSTMPDTPGLAVWHSGHIGVYIGNGEVVEAMGTKYGVVKTKLSERNWTAWLEVPYIQYEQQEDGT